jgi:hypothetical protein
VEGKYIKLAIGIAVVALIAYYVASAVFNEDIAAIKSAKPKRSRGDVRQTPVAMAPMADDSLGALAG